jgi:hypothetical protein
MASLVLKSHSHDLIAARLQFRLPSFAAFAATSPTSTVHATFPGVAFENPSAATAISTVSVAARAGYPALQICRTVQNPQRLPNICHWAEANYCYHWALDEPNRSRIAMSKA